MDVLKPIPCQRCGKTLTNPKSIARRYGRTCWRKLGVPLRTRITRTEWLVEGKIKPLEVFFGEETSR